MTTSRQRTAIIAGGGIAGLTAALALRRAGFRVDLFERAERIEPIGAGLQLSPNAMSVLSRLGLAASLRATGVSATHVTLRDGASGRVAARVPVEAADGEGYLSLHRGDLQACLLAAAQADPAIVLHLGVPLVGIVETAEDVAAVLDGGGGGGRAVRADLLVAADGVHSGVAAGLGMHPPVPTGATALRIAVPAEAGGNAQATGGIEAWLGPRRHAVSYPIRQAGERNLVLILPDGEDGTRGFAGWDRSLLRLVEAGEPLGRWPILALDAAARMAPRARTVLVGDAAHAMAPYAAQGAAMAIEDAWVLASCLVEDPDPAPALRRFAALRLPRIERVVRRVAFHRLVYHLPRPASWARDAALRMRSPASLRADLAWLYDWTAAAMPGPQG